MFLKKINSIAGIEGLGGGVSSPLFNVTSKTSSAISCVRLCLEVLGKISKMAVTPCFSLNGHSNSLAGSDPAYLPAVRATCLGGGFTSYLKYSRTGNCVWKIYPMVPTHAALTIRPEDLARNSIQWQHFVRSPVVNLCKPHKGVLVLGEQVCVLLTQ